MEPEHKGKRLPYEPPKIYELDVDLTQAMGQTRCNPGQRAAGACTNGAQAQAPGCTNGGRPAGRCVGGGNPTLG